MENTFTRFMVKMADHELDAYLTQYLKYDIQAVEAAFSELANRGRPVPESQLQIIRSELRNRDEDKKNQPQSTSTLLDSLKNVIDDPTAPLLYSQFAINVFSVLVTPLFGSILLAMNLRSLRRTRGIMVVLLFGILWFAAILFLMEFITERLFLPIWNMLGAGALFSFFWPRYIGKDLKYRKRTIWIPLLILVLISILFILVESFV